MSDSRSASWRACDACWLLGQHDNVRFVGDARKRLLRRTPLELVCEVLRGFRVVRARGGARGLRKRGASGHEAAAAELRRRLAQLVHQVVGVVDAQRALQQRRRST